MEDSYLGMLHNDPCHCTDNCVVVLKNQLIAVEQGEASTGIVQVATASVGVEQNSREKKARTQAVIWRGNVVD